MSGSRPSGSAASIRRRATILEATRALIAERGVEKLLVADVAERAEVSVATIYNLIGTRDRLLVALLDDATERVRTRLANDTTDPGIDGCTSVIRTACEVALTDADTMRAILANLGSAVQDQWLDDGLESSIRRSVDAAVAAGALETNLPADAVTAGLLIGFRGALMSWVFGFIADEALAANAEFMALSILANAATSTESPAIDDRLIELATRLD